MGRLRSSLLTLLFLTAVYLFAWPAPTLLYAGVVLLHVTVGVALVLAVLPVVGKIFRGIGLVARAGWLLTLAGAALGVVLIFTGTRRHDWPLLYAHIATSLAGIALLTAEWAGARRRPSDGSFGFAPEKPRVKALRAAFFLLGAALLAAGAWWVRTVPWQRAYRIENPSIAPASMDAEGGGPRGPFFPSSAQTVNGGPIPARFFMESEACQRCHADIFRQWTSSAHHFSSFNNQWYRKSVEYMQDVVGVRPSKWCGGCHDPALLFSGMMDRPIRGIVKTPEAHAGLGCVMCHSIAAVKSTMGQGDYTLEYSALHKLAASKRPVLRRLHDFLVELNPEPHRRVFLKPFLRDQTAEFCSVCHKLHLDVPVNHYRWTRGFNEYDNWQASGVSGFGARSFYYPPKSQNCADCHMTLVPSHDAGNIHGFVHSHRFLAANTAVPFANKDEMQVSETEKFLEDGKLRVDIFAISPEKPPPKGQAALAMGAPRPEFQTTFAVGEEAEVAFPAGAAGAPPAAEVTAPLNRVQPAVRQGDTVRVDVVVRTLKVGHFFPGGTVDAFDCWLELKAADDRGRVIFWSGKVEDNGRGPVEPGAHFYRSLLIDARGNMINKRNAWAARAAVYAHLIPPGAADTAHFRLRVPKDAKGPIHLEAKLNYRKFSWWNTHFSFAGVMENKGPNDVTKDYDNRRAVFTGDTSNVSGQIKTVPNLPIVTLASASADLEVLPAAVPAPAPKVALEKDDWQRWNDYGIGLLLQGDLKGAEAAFEHATEIAPNNPDGWINIGRVRVQEGNLPAAQRALERALALDPHLARAHFFYAKTLRNEGRYDEAIVHLRQVLSQYPRDRVAHDELGRILFLERRYPEAAQEFQSTLAIDPEDLEANYNLMLCATGMGEPSRAREYEQRYLRFKADESAQALTGPYLRAHPEDNLERQAIHEHVSVPLETIRALQGDASSPRAGGGD